MEASMLLRFPPSIYVYILLPFYSLTLQHDSWLISRKRMPCEKSHDHPPWQTSGVQELVVEACETHLNIVAAALNTQIIFEL
jgi:hypothetical protein